MFCSMLALAGIAFPDVCGAAPPTHRVVSAPRYERLEPKGSEARKSCPKSHPYEVGVVCYDRPVGQFDRDPNIPMVAVTEECLDKRKAPDNALIAAEQPKCELKVKKIKILPPT